MKNKTRLRIRFRSKGQWFSSREFPVSEMDSVIRYCSRVSPMSDKIRIVNQDGFSILGFQDGKPIALEDRGQISTPSLRGEDVFVS